MDSSWLDWAAVAVLGGVVGASELISRYKDDPGAAIQSKPAIFYIAINVIASLGALELIYVKGWFGPSRWTQILMAGISAMAFFRTSRSPVLPRFAPVRQPQYSQYSFEDSDDTNNGAAEYAERAVKPHRTNRLEGQLESYSSVARSSATRATLRQRMGNWPAYAAATGSALAMATSASATTISYAGPSLTASASSVFSASQHVKLGTAPTFFLTARHLANSFGAALAGRSMSLLHETSGTVKKLGFGQGISAGAGSFSVGKPVLDFRLATGTHSGEWVAGAPGFEGFKFRTTLGAGTQTNYGWAELEVNVDGQGLPDSVTLLGLAYNNDGSPISTPSSGVPEPGSAGLMLLALGAAGVAVLRKRKQQTAQS